LTIDETPAAVEAMKRAQDRLRLIRTADIAWNNYNITPGQTTLD
jgi:hypothetical protein